MSKVQTNIVCEGK